MIETKTSIHVSNASTRSDRRSQALAWIVVGSCAIFTAGVIASAAINGPKLRAIAEQKAAAELDAEDSAFCQKLGMSSGTEADRNCKLDLTELHRRQEDRERSAVNLP